MNSTKNGKCSKIVENLNFKTYLSYLIIRFFIFNILFGCVAICTAQRWQYGSITEADSKTPIPFAYVILKSNGNGTVSDMGGQFSLFLNQLPDTLEVRYLGKAIKTIVITDSTAAFLKIVMQYSMYQLNPVVISTISFKPYERRYMDKIINQTQGKFINTFQSPITALYLQYSKEGRQLQKLSQLFQNIYEEEIIESKLNARILKILTVDSNLDHQHFLRYCRVFNAEYILNHSELELYNEVMKCYRQWQSEPFQRLRE